MAIFHFSVAVLKRSEGRSAVAAAAWRSGQTLFDERLHQRTQLPKSKRVVFETVLLPEGAPEELSSREVLWNSVEVAEKQRNSQLARIIDAAIPHELSLEEAVRLARAFATGVLLPFGFAVDLTVSRGPGAEAAAHLHGYFMIPTRILGPSGFGQKHRLPNYRAELMEWRRAWAELVNEALAGKGLTDRVDHRSHVARGIDAEPTPHAGIVATQMARRGILRERARSGPARGS